jgi:antiviral helicase SKI2
LELQEAAKEERIGKDGLLRIAPGMSRGLAFGKAKNPQEELAEVEKEVNEEGFKFGDVAPRRRPRAESGHELGKRVETHFAELDRIDDLLPIEVRLQNFRTD